MKTPESPQKALKKHGDASVGGGDRGDGRLQLAALATTLMPRQRTVP